MASSRNRHREGPLGAGAHEGRRSGRSYVDREPGRDRRAAEPAGRPPPGPEPPPCMEGKTKKESDIEFFVLLSVKHGRFPQHHMSTFTQFSSGLDKYIILHFKKGIVHLPVKSFWLSLILNKLGN